MMNIQHIPTILVLIRLSRWTDPIFAFPCTLRPAAEGPSSALSSRPCDISWAHLSGLPKRWHFFGGFPGQSFQGALLYSWVVERRLILTGLLRRPTSEQSPNLNIRCYMIVFQCSHTPTRWVKLYPLSEPSVCRFGKPAFTNWEAFTNGEKPNSFINGPCNSSPRCCTKAWGWSQGKMQV